MDHKLSFTLICFLLSFMYVHLQQLPSAPQLPSIPAQPDYGQQIQNGTSNAENQANQGINQGENNANQQVNNGQTVNNETIQEGQQYTGTPTVPPFGQQNVTIPGWSGQTEGFTLPTLPTRPSLPTIPTQNTSGFTFPGFG